MGLSLGTEIDNDASLSLGFPDSSSPCWRPVYPTVGQYLAYIACSAGVISCSAGDVVSGVVKSFFHTDHNSQLKRHTAMLPALDDDGSSSELNLPAEERSYRQRQAKVSWEATAMVMISRLWSISDYLASFLVRRK